MSTVSQFPSPSPPVVLHPFLDLFINLSAQTDNAARPFYYCIEAFLSFPPPSPRSLPFLPSDIFLRTPYLGYLAFPPTPPFLMYMYNDDLVALLPAAAWSMALPQASPFTERPPQ